MSVIYTDISVGDGGCLVKPFGLNDKTYVLFSKTADSLTTWEKELWLAYDNFSLR